MEIVDRQMARDGSCILGVDIGGTYVQIGEIKDFKIDTEYPFS